MADSLAPDLVDKRLATNQLVLTVGYDRETWMTRTVVRTTKALSPPTDTGERFLSMRSVQKTFPYTSSANDLLKAVTALYDRIVDKNLLVRRLSISAKKLLP